MESLMQDNAFYCCIESLTLWHVTLHPEQHLLGASSWINIPEHSLAVGQEYENKIHVH